VQNVIQQSEAKNVTQSKHKMLQKTEHGAQKTQGGSGGRWWVAPRKRLRLGRGKAYMFRAKKHE